MFELGQAVVFTPRNTYGVTWDRRHYSARITSMHAASTAGPASYTVARDVPGGDVNWHATVEGDPMGGASFGSIRGDGWRLVLERGEGLPDIECVYALAADALSAFHAAVSAPRSDVLWTTLFELHDGDWTLADMRPSPAEARRLLADPEAGAKELLA